MYFPKLRFHPSVVTAHIRAPTSVEEDALECFHRHALTCHMCRDFLNYSNNRGFCPQGEREASYLCRLIHWKDGHYVATRPANKPYDIVVEIPRYYDMSRKLLLNAAPLWAHQSRVRGQNLTTSPAAERYSPKRSRYSRRKEKEFNMLRITEFHQVIWRRTNLYEV